MTTSALTLAAPAFADGGAGGGTNGGAGGTGYTGAGGTAGTVHGGGGGGAAGGGLGAAGGPGDVTNHGIGGTGGNGGLNNQNGGTNGNGRDGSPGGVGPPNGGGSGGGGGGGGAGFYYSTSITDLLGTAGSATVKGGNGGAAGKGWANGGAGGKGGDGGAGLLMDNGYSVTVNVTSVTGGKGGRGGDGASANDPGVAGKGGDGGAGVIASAGGNVTISLGTVTGGDGGNGGNGGPGNPGTGGNGGNGGAGVAVAGSGTVAVGTGTSIIGGNGGAIGTTGTSGTPVAGTGGAGIKASGGTSVTVAGTVKGGMSGDASPVQADAIDFTGGGNSLTLQNGYAFTGHVVSDATGSGDSLALGGSDNGSFSLTDLGTVFQSFGYFQKTGSNTWTVTSSSSFSGYTTVSAGTLALQSASLANSEVAVAGGGTLSVTGASTVSSLDVYGITTMADATASLGSGNVTFESGSTFLTAVAAGGIGNIQSNAGVQLDGGAVKVSGSPSYGASYVIVSGPAVAGAFAGAEMANGTAFILPTLHYDVGGEVYLTFARASFASVARTPNQSAVAGAIDQQGAGGAIGTELMSMTPAEAEAAYDALSGNSYASTETAMVEQSFTTHDLMVDRLLSHASNHLWGRIFSTVESGNDGNAAPYVSRTGGAMGGTDTVIGDWRLGAMLGYGRGAFATATSSEDSAQYYAGIYASTSLGKLQLRTGAGYTRAQIEATRKVVVGGLSNMLSGSYGADVGQAFAELGYRLDVGGARIEPFGSLTKVVVKTGSLTETGGATALSVNAANEEITLATLGLHGLADFTIGTTSATLQATLAWQHTFGRAPRTGMTFQTGGSFNADGAPLATDSAIVRADLGVHLAPNAVLSLSYAGEFSARTTSHTANAEFNVQF